MWFRDAFIADFLFGLANQGRDFLSFRISGSKQTQGQKTRAHRIKTLLGSGYPDWCPGREAFVTKTRKNQGDIIMTVKVENPVHYALF